MRWLTLYDMLTDHTIQAHLSPDICRFIQRAAYELIRANAEETRYSEAAVSGTTQAMASLVVTADSDSSTVDAVHTLQ